MEEEKKVNGVFICREKWEEVMLEIKISYFHYLVKVGGVGDWWDLGFGIFDPDLLIFLTNGDENAVVHFFA